MERVSGSFILSSPFAACQCSTGSFVVLRFQCVSSCCCLAPYVESCLSLACVRGCPQVALLRQRFQKSIEPGGIAGDRAQVVPASALPLSFEEIWKRIRLNKDLDLPAHKVGLTCCPAAGPAPRPAPWPAPWPATRTAPCVPASPHRASATPPILRPNCQGPSLVSSDISRCERPGHGGHSEVRTDRRGEAAAASRVRGQPPILPCASASIHQPHHGWACRVCIAKN